MFEASFDLCVDILHFFNAVVLFVKITLCSIIDFYVLLKSHCLVIVLNFLHRQPNHLYKDGFFFSFGFVCVCFCSFCFCFWSDMLVGTSSTVFSGSGEQEPYFLFYCLDTVIFNKWLGVL